MFSVSNGQNRKLDMSDSTSQKRLPTFLTVCFPNNTKEEESFFFYKNAHINQSIKWLNVSFDLNEAPTSLLLIFRKPRGADNAFEAGLFMVPCGPRHFYLTEPSGAVELGSRMKSVILHEVGGVRKRMQCAHNPAPQESFICACQLHAHPLGFFSRLHRKYRVWLGCHSSADFLFLCFSFSLIQHDIFWVLFLWFMKSLKPWPGFIATKPFVFLKA